MNTLVKATKHFFNDEKAAEVTELGIVLALIVAASVVVLGSIGGKVLDAYRLTDSNL